MTHHALDPARFAGQVDGQPVELITLRNRHGMQAGITNLGAKLLQLLVPGPQGSFSDVCLGYDDLQGVLKGSPSMGAFVGRYAGRIGNARAVIDGVSYALPVHPGSTFTMHGGPQGSRHRAFTLEQRTSSSAHLSLRFTPEHDGLPGVMDLHLHYELSDDNALVVRHEITAIQGAGVASVTSHGYFNLDGAGALSTSTHTLEVDANHVIDTTDDGVATGHLVPLDGHALDLRRATTLTAQQPIDHGYVLRPDPGLRRVARLSSASSGRWMDVWTTEPVMQVYTAAHLGARSVPDIGKQGLQHRPFAAVCLEPQSYPNAPNCPNFPLPRIAPGQPQRGETVYRFGLLTD